MAIIKVVKAIEILDSRGVPTIETEVVLEDGSVGRTSVASGASCGSTEALELRDNDNSRFSGKGVSNAVRNVNEIISKKLLGVDAFEQKLIDDLLISVDGTENKSHLGANALLSVSLSVAKAQSRSQGLPYYRYLRRFYANETHYNLPVPMINLINGGKHADNRLDIQEFMIMPVAFSSFKDAITASVEIFYKLKQNIKASGYSVNVGDEGGFAPDISDSRRSLDFLLKSIVDAGYTPGKDIFLAIDAAASEFYNPESRKYSLDNMLLSSEEMIEYYAKLLDEYPIISMEDPLSEFDRDSWSVMTRKLESKIQIVGDDIFTTNTKLLNQGMQDGIANSILVKPNQIGTLSETLEVMQLAKSGHYENIASHRSGETEDVVIVHIAISMNCNQIKIGSLSRSERVAKYNEIIRIEKTLLDDNQECSFVGSGILLR